MKISCIMPTANRRAFVPSAIERFLAQDHEDKELIILDDGDDCIADVVPAHSEIRYVRLSRRQPLGAKRNLACEQATGDLIAHWDDDDWYAASRLRRQAAALVAAKADICGLDRALFLDKGARRAWEYVYADRLRPWVCGATLCFTKVFWARNRFPEIAIGEDTQFVFAAKDARILALPDRDLFVGMIHDGNSAPKRMRDSRWHPCPIGTIEAVMHEGRAAAHSKPAAAVSAGGGIGDVIRTTPLVRVLHGLGYTVDLLLAPDDPAVIGLLRGAPELRRVALCGTANGRTELPPEIRSENYAVATLTTWSPPLAGAIHAERLHCFTRNKWRASGDAASIETIARELGWKGPLPPAFVQTSGRAFGLPSGTVALHPGCKPNWPWKKWHGFDALARLLPEVAIVGTPADLDNGKTYFKRSFDWPPHARNFIGQLDLPDTAALISQCAALVSNDSGLMHLAGALGVPTFGIFGITSPARELGPSPTITPVSKGLPCEPDCRKDAWGRRDCDRHLQCLKSLTAQEVLTRMQAVLPNVAKPHPPSPRRSDAAAAISLNYFGNVFDASGYGQAARAYVHALHKAGVNLSVVDTGARPPQVHDPLISSLLGENRNADFNLLHGIPSTWGLSERRLPNLIAMTVWETDSMPRQWIEPLSRAIDVWLPCRFNVDVFSRILPQRAFTLPHPIPPQSLTSVDETLPPALARISPDDFVFYGIFEWQDRKNPAGTIEAFLRAFPDERDAVLVLKSNPGAFDEARTTLSSVRGAIGKKGRIFLCCEAWSEAQVRALHARGDCYVSLHKGEGWGYPLFEAAAHGKPVVATDYSGPRDYLDRRRHWLVRHRLSPVRQRYHLYGAEMNWANPDIAHAAQGMRWIYDHRADACNAAAEAARQLEIDFSLERIGAAAEARLLHLVGRRSARKAAWLKQNSVQRLRPPLPIPAEWFDADYFDLGRKSNWTRGYSWPLFEGVFRNAARYLTELFPGARSFLDVGCGKGFLIRALRESGQDAWGFDFSEYAFTHAEPSAKPFIQLSDAVSARYDRQFDVTVAMWVLESLTEEQIRHVLRRARSWTKSALLAVIATTGHTDEVVKKLDRDLSRATLRDRAWWRSEFHDAGWRQDAEWLDFEDKCRSHPVAKTMNWDVHVFAAGH